MPSGYTPRFCAWAGTATIPKPTVRRSPSLVVLPVWSITSRPFSVDPRLTSLDPHEICPEMLEALSPTEQSGEDRRVGQDDLAPAFSLGGHPNAGVELLVARIDERMGPVQIDRLAREDVDRLAVVAGERVVRQVLMEIERGHLVEQAQLIQILDDRQRRDLAGAFDDRGPEPVLIGHRDAEPFHQ